MKKVLQTLGHASEPNKAFSVSSSNKYEIYSLINVKMPKIVVGILTFISRIHSAAEYKSKIKCLFFSN